MADLALQTNGQLHLKDCVDLQTYDVASGLTFAVGTVLTFDSSGYLVLADANVHTLRRPVFLASTAATTSETGVTVVRNGIVDGFDLTNVGFGDPVYLSATAGKLSDAPILVNQIQTVAITGTLTGGHFHLSFDGLTTGNIAYNANAAAIQAAIEALANVGLGNVVVAGTVASFTITFQQDLMGDNPLVTVTTTDLTTSDSISSSVTDTTPGAANLVCGFCVPSRTKQSTNEKCLKFCPGAVESQI